jgi:hypothetical protein
MIAADNVVQSAFALLEGEDIRGKFPDSLRGGAQGCPRMRAADLQVIEVPTGSFVHRNQVLASHAARKVFTNIGKCIRSVNATIGSLILNQVFNLLNA